MKPVIVSHPDYRRFLSGVGGMYRINWRSYPPAVREIYIRFRELDLSAVDRIMQDQYSNRGPESRQPSCMLRSLFLMIVILDYLLEAGKHHSTKFWYVRLYLIMMLIHMTSWNLPE